MRFTVSLRVSFRVKNLFLGRLWIHFPKRMVVQEVWFDTAELSAVVDLNPDVIEKRTNGGSLIEKYIFRPLKQLQPLGVVWFQCGGRYQIVVLFTSPAGSIVSAPGYETINEGIGIVVIANP